MLLHKETGKVGVYLHLQFTRVFAHYHSYPMWYKLIFHYNIIEKYTVDSESSVLVDVRISPYTKACLEYWNFRLELYLFNSYFSLYLS